MVKWMTDEKGCSEGPTTGKPHKSATPPPPGTATIASRRPLGKLPKQPTTTHHPAQNANASDPRPSRAEIILAAPEPVALGTKPLVVRDLSSRLRIPAARSGVDHNVGSSCRDRAAKKLVARVGLPGVALRIFHVSGE